MADLLTPDAKTGLAVRLACRSGRLTGPTAGLAPGFLQVNLISLPAEIAAEFLTFCQLNPGPCPLIGVSEPGQTALPTLGADLDLRTDAPRYVVWHDGAVIDRPTTLLDHWRDDLVTFALGCSFSFEAALHAEGIGLRHVEQGCNVPMYRTTIACTPAGRFAGPMVVSMRPMRPADAIRAVLITANLPRAHGAPVHIGLPHLIGITDLTRPDYGDSVRIHADELPVFWACGVTPQALIAAQRLPFAITHAPGCMLVTDLTSEQKNCTTPNHTRFSAANATEGSDR